MPPVGYRITPLETALSLSGKALTALKADTLYAMMRNAAFGGQLDSLTVRLKRLQDAGRLVTTAPANFATTAAGIPNIAPPNFSLQMLIVVSGFNAAQQTSVHLGGTTAMATVSIEVGLVLSSNLAFIKEVLVYQVTRPSALPVSKIFGWNQETGGGPWVTD